ncbi:MAG: type II secretion system protein GspF, partial [Desulfobulbaceae bacterium]|nr:type II secretion system protein GspF [Desulfobulbaceae bacterium]
MPLFEYTGLDNHGRKVSGRIDGPGLGPVRQQLREKGIFPTGLHESSLAGARRGWLDLRSLLHRCSTAELASATRQLATLLVAGLSLDTALGSVAEQADQSMIGQVLANVR